MNLAMEWVLERHRRHYQDIYWFLAPAIASVMLVVPATAVTVLVIDLPRSVHLEMQAVVIASLVVAAVGGWTAHRQRVGEPIDRYLRAEEVDPAVVLDACLVAPQRYAATIGIVGTPLAGIGLALVTREHLADVAVAVLALAGLIGAAVTALWVYGNRMLFRPIIRELLTEHPELMPAPGRQRAVRQSILVGAAALTLFGVLLGAAIGTQVDDVSARIGAIVVVMPIAMAWSAVVFSVLISSPMLGPLDELTVAARRVGAGDLEQFVPLASRDELGDLVISFNDMVIGLRERERLHAAFGSYVDPALAERLLAQGDSLFAGEEVEVTVMFVDVRDFTSYAARVGAQSAVARLNSLFDIVVPSVVSHGGHANKYLGDGALAVFGVPEPHGDHADRAVRAAIEIQREVAARLPGVRMGIGINTGPVIAGTIGGGGKLEFTLIGDVVNVASRVEELTKRTGDPILLTGETAAALTDPSIRVLSRGRHDVRGKAEPIELVVPASAGEPPTTAREEPGP